MNFDEIGEMSLGSRLRTLSGIVTKDARQLYELYNVDLKPKWFPVYYYLSNAENGMSITELAQAIGNSHPAIIKVVKEMINSGLVSGEKDKSDGRKNNIILTEKGRTVSRNIQPQYADVEKAIKNALAQTQHNLWLAIQEFEYLLKEKSLFKRVVEQKKLRLSKDVEIKNYQSKYAKEFKQLNEEWINTFFKMEQADIDSLANPESYILDKGGEILIALFDSKVVGVCALQKMEHENYDFELAKMAVSPNVQGKGIGFLLGKSIIELAKLKGAKNIYLESNTILDPAISLYRKLGFRKVTGLDSPYERCNIQMMILL